MRITSAEATVVTQNYTEFRPRAPPQLYPWLFLWDMPTFRGLGKYLKINVQVVLIIYYNF